MYSISLFVEDRAHRVVIGALLERFAAEQQLEVQLHWRRSKGGFGKVITDLKDYLRDFDKDMFKPNMIVIATDSNCSGLNERTNQINELGIEDIPIPVVLAIPDPHIERWLLIDGQAFKAVFNQGCQQPDKKCERDRYKKLLRQSIEKTGVRPTLLGIEFAEDIVNAMDISRIMRTDRSFKRFVKDVKDIFKQWKLS